MSARRLLYTLAWIAALPAVALYLLRRSLRQPEYRQHWGERFLGRGTRPAGGPVVWIHAVSLGETRAAAPLIDALAQARPDLHFVLTHMTPTGRAAGAELAARWPGRLVQRYLPYELPWALGRFFRETAPVLGVVMETEVWPNLLAAARQRGLPVALVNARLSEKSLARALRVEGLMREAATGFALVLAQAPADAQRLRRLYQGPCEVMGNLKFDLRPDPALLAAGAQLHHTIGQRSGSAVSPLPAAQAAPDSDASPESRNPLPVWLLAASRDGEEALLLDELARASPSPAHRLIVVPRHPQRFDEVAKLIEARGWRCLRRSLGQWPAVGDASVLADDVVLLGDTLGEMPLYYAAADLTLMGGSLLPFGSQNLIESCAAGTPVVLGPSVFNFAQAAADAISAGAALQVGSIQEAVAALTRLSADPAARRTMADCATRFAQAHRGATERSVQRLISLLPPP
jgi:3-deoxy-D-manno-octulosonic-acid transferase